MLMLLEGEVAGIGSSGDFVWNKVERTSSQVYRQKRTEGNVEIEDFSCWDYAENEKLFHRILDFFS